jgi:hypothetical protein
MSLTSRTLPGSLAPWLPGSLAPWLPGSLAPWLPGSLAPWLSHSAGSALLLLRLPLPEARPPAVPGIVLAGLCSAAIHPSIHRLSSLESPSQLSKTTSTLDASVPAAGQADAKF